MPSPLPPARPTPPANEPPLDETGQRFSQPWLNYFQAVSDWLVFLGGGTTLADAPSRRAPP